MGSGKILIIDDEPHILHSLSFVLTHEGYSVDTARGGRSGLEKIREFQPHLVFLDIMLPQMTGYEVLAQVKGDPQLQETYIILLTAKGQEADREKGLTAGADEYITKPFSPKKILERVRKIMERKQSSS